jgi:NADH-quinone oxidoreductase subunit N
MNTGQQLENIRISTLQLMPELVLCSGILILILLGLIRRTNSLYLLSGFTLFIFIVSLNFVVIDSDETAFLFGMMKKDSFSSYLKILMDVAGLLTCLMSLNKKKLNQHKAEYFLFITAVVLGGHLLVMSHHFAMVFLSLELISISSYVLVGYNFNRHASEGSMKYFIFGSVGSAIMLYGFTLLYGLTGILDFTSPEFTTRLIDNGTPLILLAGIMSLGGFLFKMTAVPMHPWAPDVYEAAPVPVIAFLSVAPKLAGLGALTKFVFAIHLFGQSGFDWQMITASIAILTITVGNFSALAQTNPKRMMAYSSIAQSGFLLVGIAAFLPSGIHHMLFYASVYVVMNFIVFLYLNYFANEGIETIAAFSGIGKRYLWPSIFLLTGLIALTGLPPTSGFTAKLFIFSSLWQAYELSGKPVLLWLLVFGLLNTVISLFYYLKIPYYSFLKAGPDAEKPNNITLVNLLGFILVIVTLILFFLPGLLMGWINRINFVL